MERCQRQHSFSSYQKHSQWGILDLVSNTNSREYGIIELLGDHSSVMSAWFWPVLDPPTHLLRSCLLSFVHQIVSLNDNHNSDSFLLPRQVLKPSKGANKTGSKKVPGNSWNHCVPLKPTKINTTILTRFSPGGFAAVQYIRKEILCTLV